MKKISLLVLVCFIGVLLIAGCGQQTSNTSTQAASIANPISKIYLTSANGAVDISWEASASAEVNIAGYNIYRSTTSGANYLKVATIKYGKVYWDSGADWKSTSLNQYQVNTTEASISIYPNPCSFASSYINIRYTLYKHSDTTLEVYNVHGEKIFQEEYFAQVGTHVKVWDGKKNDGALITQGIYPFRIISEGLELAASDTNVKGGYIVAAGSSSLTNGIPYYYVMTAFTTAGTESAYSSEESVIPLSTAKSTIWQRSYTGAGYRNNKLSEHQ